jgi:hypothetical protein
MKQIDAGEIKNEKARREPGFRDEYIFQSVHFASLAI